MTDIVVEAVDFARHFHEGQIRKHTNEPYILHPTRVAFMLAPLTNDQATLAAAMLHDVLEDTAATEELLLETFGPRVTRYVVDISNLHKGNRKTRKLLYREQLGKADIPVKSIKLADMLDNCPSIIKYDPDFAKVYMKEQKDQLPYLEDGFTSLYLKTRRMIHDYFKEIKNGK